MKPDPRALREAADWFACLTSEHCSSAERDAWQQWLQQPPNAAAWQRVERISGGMQRLATDAAGRQASAALEHDPSRRRALKSLCLVGAAGVLGWQLEQRRPWQPYLATWRTATGEIREERLADGLQLWLNTGTAVDDLGSPAQRHLALRQGEILLDCPARALPLQLDCRQGQLRVETPARFAVRDDGASDRLRVFSGSVLLQPAARGLASRIEAGQEVYFDRYGVHAPQAITAQDEDWRRGMLVVDGWPLGRLIDELARYRRGHLSCAAEVAQLRVVGAFPLTDSDRALEALARSLPVRIRRPLRWWVSIEAVG